MNTELINDWKQNFVMQIDDYNFTFDTRDDEEVISSMEISNGRINSLDLNYSEIEISGKGNDVIVDGDALNEILENRNTVDTTILRNVLRNYLKDAIIVSDITDEYPSVISTGFAIDEIIANYRREI